MIEQLHAMPETIPGIQTAENTISSLQPVLPRGAGGRVSWGRLYGSSYGLVVSAAAQQHDGLVVLVTADTRSAARMTQEIEFFNNGGEPLPLLSLPDWETLPYDAFSPHQDIISDRLATLYRLPRTPRGILVVPVMTLMHRLLPREYLEASSLMLDIGMRLDVDQLRSDFSACGYRYVSQVMEHGEFAVRGNLIDLYPMGSSVPYRIDLFDEEVESIRAFDPETQRSLYNIQNVRLLPAREFPLDADGIKRFRESYRATFEGDPQRSLIYRDVSNGLAPAGIEYYLPLFYEHTATLFDYLAPDTMFIACEGVKEAADHFWTEAVERFEQHRIDPERPALDPQRLYQQVPHVFQAIGNFPRVTLERFELEQRAGHYNFATHAVPNLAIQHRAADPAAALKHFLENFEGRVLFAAESAGRRETLQQLFSHHNIHPVTFDHWQADVWLWFSLSGKHLVRDRFTGPDDDEFVVPRSVDHLLD